MLKKKIGKKHKEQKEFSSKNLPSKSLLSDNLMKLKVDNILLIF